MNDAIQWGTVAQWVSPVVAILLAIWAVIRSGNKEAFDTLSTKIDSGLRDIKGDIQALRADDARLFERSDKKEARLSAIETEMRHIPTRDEFHELDKRLVRLDEKIAASFESLDEKITTIIAQNERAQERLARREDDMISRLNKGQA